MTDTPVEHRPRARLQLGTYTIEIEQLDPRSGFRAAMMVVRMLGPALAGLVSAGGLRVPEGDTTRLVPWTEIVASGAAWGVVDHALKRSASFDPDDMLALLDAMIVGHAWAVQGDARMPIREASMLNSIAPTFLGLVGLFRCALKLNAGPILPVLATFGAGREGETSERPAVTP